MRFLVLTSLALLLLAVSPWAPAAPHFKDGEGKACKVRVEGEGYLRFVRDGRVVYAKEAALQAIDGKLCHSEGAPVIPTISVAAPFMVNLEGNVVAGGKSVGRLVLAHFPASASLRPDGPFLVAAERPRLAEPGEGDSGVIRSVGVATPGVTPA
ncbi:MAG TPA: hypothetical protein VM328_08900, partial [Fimbriimonadaceae bacterium]|nr:hypothetical protein [Fimbriimonadaceae bacterium]